MTDARKHIRAKRRNYSTLGKKNVGKPDPRFLIADRATLSSLSDDRISSFSALAKPQDTVICDIFRATSIPDLYNKKRVAGWRCDSVTNQALDLCQPGVQWSGITCSNGVVTGINFNSQDLVNGMPSLVSGTIPSSIGLLTDLVSIEFSFTALRGTVPTSVGLLSMLTRFSLRNSQFSATIPSQISRMSKLVSLDLSLNNFKGSIPLGLYSISTLQSLAISYCSLSFILPSSIGFLTNLQTLDLTANKIFGSLPSTLGNLMALSVLNLGSNSLTGLIPASLGQLSNFDTINLKYNSLAGSIPNNVNWPNMRQLFLHWNSLTGTIPSALGLSTKMQDLQLYSNSLSGTIPTTLGNMRANLLTFYLHINALTGAVPLELCWFKQPRFSMLAGYMNKLSCYWSCMDYYADTDFKSNKLSKCLPPTPGKSMYLLPLITSVLYRDADLITFRFRILTVF